MVLKLPDGTSELLLEIVAHTVMKCLKENLTIFKDALHEMRREWNGFPRRLEMPDGTNYKFPKTHEWEAPSIYVFYFKNG